MAILQEKNGVEDFEMKLAQGAKKIRIDFTVLLIRIPQKRSLVVGQVKNSFH